MKGSLTVVVGLVVAATASPIKPEKKAPREPEPLLVGRPATSKGWLDPSGFTSSPSPSPYDTVAPADPPMMPPKNVEESERQVQLQEEKIKADGFTFKEDPFGIATAYIQPAFNVTSCGGENPCPCTVTTYNDTTSCISNYNTSGYENNERCTFAALRTVKVFSPRFSTEGYFDQLTINGQAYSGSQPYGVSGPNGVTVGIDSNISWRSDYSVTSTGFTVCVIPAFTVLGAARGTQCRVFLQPGTGTPCFSNLAYSSNEACTIGVSTTVQLNVLNFSTEQYYDTLVVNGVAFSGTNSPQSQIVPAGGSIYWKSDSSVTAGGFLICANPAFTVVRDVPSPTTPTKPGPCLVTTGYDGRSCLYDRNYNNNEQCTATVNVPNAIINTDFFDTEANYDFLTIGSMRYSGRVGPQNLAVHQETEIEWSSDFSNTGAGWEICADITSPCSATCNSDGSVDLPAVQFSEILVQFGQPGNYKGTSPYMHNSCCGEQGGFCHTGTGFQDNQCRNALSVLNQIGYNGPALTCKFYSCRSPTGSTTTYSRLAYVNPQDCYNSSQSLANTICNAPPQTTQANYNGFLCSQTGDDCVSVHSVPGTGPKEGVSLSTCRSTCGISAGRYACKGAQGCQLSSAGTSLYFCQQTCRVENGTAV